MTALVIGQGLDLAQLVQSCNDRWTVSEMSMRARRKGFMISPSELAAYAASEVDQRPSRTQLRALSAALDISLVAVEIAASRQFAWRARREVCTKPAPQALPDLHPSRRTTSRHTNGRHLLFARVVAGVVATLSCPVLIYVYLLSVTDARFAVIGTVALTGTPVMFLATRLTIYLNAHERGSGVPFWPPDGSLLLKISVFCMAAAAGWALDHLVFDGQITALLNALMEE